MAARTKVSARLEDHEGKYLVAIQKRGLIYITAHRPQIAAYALNAAHSMVSPVAKHNKGRRVFVLRVLAEVKTPYKDI